MTIDKIKSLKKMYLDERCNDYRKSGDYTGLPFHFGNDTFPNGFDVLAILFDEIPDNQKYQIVIGVYTNLKLQTTRMLKYLEAIKPLVPVGIIETIRDKVDAHGNITVYRGGIVVENPALCTSWTLSKKTAEWFAEQAFPHEAVVYRGAIKADDVIAYENDREEAEIIQYNNVTQIEVIKSFH